MRKKSRAEAVTLEKESVKNLLRALMPELRRVYRVRSLALFGSVVRGEARARSDIDLLVEFEDADFPVSLLEFISLRNFLSDKLGRRVDLVEKQTLRPTLRERILREAESI
ncbi:MAG: nucleotidyltransferase family protein [Armatimonadetes bacterium]|jgi:predicted nucleotidyltransferase|nr:nucleotidyltransferase family protein [Armatimonadota bacterium]